MNTDRKPRVVMWRRELLPGSETFIRSQLKGLRRWSGTALGLVKVESALSDPSDNIIFKSNRVDSLKIRALSAFRFSRRVERSLSGLKPDLVHAHFAMDAILIAPVCHMLHIPFVVSVYGVDVTAMAARSGLRGVLYRRKLKSMFEKSAKILAVSEYLAEASKTLGAPEAKVVVHRLGIDLDKPPRDTSNWSWDVLLVGRLVEKKGADVLLDAIASITNRAENPVRVAIIGDGPLRERLEEQAEKLGVAVDFLGAQGPEVVRDVMRRSRILAVPSKTARNGDSEGLPMILLEGAAMSLPIVASRHSGIPEFVSHGVSGLLSDERDIETLAKNIEILLGDDAFARMLADEALRKVRAEYGIATQSVRLEEFYDDVLNGPS